MDSKKRKGLTHSPAGPFISKDVLPIFARFMVAEHLRFLFLLVCVILIPLSGCEENKQDIPPNQPVVDRSLFLDLDSLVCAGKAQALDELFTRLQKRTGFNGTVLYAEKGRIVFQKAYGWRNPRSKTDSLRIDDAFQLASVSKMFTALAIMILKNEGKLDYDTDIREYLPDFPYEDVTCRLLMNHRAGLPRYMSIAHEHWKDKKVPMDNEDMLALFRKYQPDVYFKPNMGFHYCNTNYALLANIVESVSGIPFEEFIDKKIFKPLGMTHSFVYSMKGDTSVPLYIGRGVPGYYHRGWRLYEMENDYLNGVVGDKNIYTSVTDLYKFDRSFDLFSLLPDSVVREAFVPGSKKYWKRKNNYGFGWRLKDDMDSTAYHFGWWKGFRTFYIRDMADQQTLIVLTNKDRGPGSDNFWNIVKADTLPLGPCSPLPEIN